MSFLDYFRAARPKKSAAIAKERLQIIVAHERHARLGGSPNLDFLPLLQQDLLEVIRKYFPIQNEHLTVKIDKEGDCEILELNIALTDLEQKPGGVKD